MSKRIVIETDILNHVRSQMDKLQGELTRLADRLQSIPLDQASGGELDINAALHLSFSGTVQRGRTISQAVRAYGRGLTATSRQVQQLENAINKAQAEAERTEKRLVREIGELASGQEAVFMESKGITMDYYVPPDDMTALAYYYEQQESLQAANDLWKTAYSEQIVQELSRLICMDDLFDREAWMQMNSAEREATARKMAEKIMLIFGTEADVVVQIKRILNERTEKTVILTPCRLAMERQPAIMWKWTASSSMWMVRMLVQPSG